MTHTRTRSLPSRERCFHLHAKNSSHRMEKEDERTFKDEMGLENLPCAVPIVVLSIFLILYYKNVNIPLSSHTHSNKVYLQVEACSVESRE